MAERHVPMNLLMNWNEWLMKCSCAIIIRLRSSWQLLAGCRLLYERLKSFMLRWIAWHADSTCVHFMFAEMYKHNNYARHYTSIWGLRKEMCIIRLAPNARYYNFRSRLFNRNFSPAKQFVIEGERKFIKLLIRDSIFLSPIANPLPAHC